MEGDDVTWLVQPRLVNDPFSDPALFIDFRFGRRALLFDLGDVTALSARELLRVTHAFVSHTHMDHFAGFDRLLRLCLHRTAPLHLVGPPAFLDQVEHILRASTWNLLDEDSLDFTLTAAEFTAGGVGGVCGFRAREAFRRRELALPPLAPGTLLLFVPLGTLKQHALRSAPGHRIVYVVDAAFHASNIASITELARGADQLFIETAFLDEDVELAAERRHLTAAQAGTLAKNAGVSR